MESEVTGRFRPSPGGPPAYPGLGEWVRWRVQGQTGGCVPALSLRPSTSCGPGLEEQCLSPVPVSDALAVAVCPGHSL